MYITVRCIANIRVTCNVHVLQYIIIYSFNRRNTLYILIKITSIKCRFMLICTIKVIYNTQFIDYPVL